MNMFTPLASDYFAREGKRACIDGKREYDNPHEEGTMPFNSWKDGFAKEYQEYLISVGETGSD